MKRVKTSDLLPGMITAEDVLNYNNQLILPKGLILTDKTITKLAFYSVISVKVEDSVANVNEKNLDEPTYAEKIRQSPEFIKFRDEFRQDVDSFKQVVNDVVEKGAPLNVDRLMNHTLNILEPGWTSPNIFDMLHSMREYDDATYVHCMNVALICNVFARWLHLSEEEIRTATISGLLHDIGKTQIPDSIIKKPGKLTEEEYSIVKTHPQVGHQMLASSALPKSILNAVLLHHEKCDGSGYPFGFSGDQIDPYAKIVSIADVYDAMTSARIYRGPLCPFKAIALFESEGLQKYDTKYILTFLENVVNTYLLNTIRLNNGVTGKIVYINKNHLSSPTIQTDHGFLDLSAHPELYIEDIV
ncbi:MAG: HD-GYP domain-containing protein [Lachnospiraceae bacterium]|nr:HD-GYP domain-containing protein [Lachnospiraceae bacterium]